MKRKRLNAGFSMAEMILVVGLIAILSGVVFMNVVEHKKNMAFMEANETAKELYLAAQEHLSRAYLQGTFDDVLAYSALNIGARTALDDDGNPVLDDEGKPVMELGTQLDGDIYAIYIKAGELSPAAKLAYDTLFPNGAIDAYVQGQNVAIRYDRATYRVLDVFYTKDTYDFDGWTKETWGWKSEGEWAEEGALGLVRSDSGMKAFPHFNGKDTDASKPTVIMGYYGTVDTTRPSGSGGDPDDPRHPRDPNAGKPIVSFSVYNRSVLYALIELNGEYQFSDMKLEITPEGGGTSVPVSFGDAQKIKDADNKYMVILDDVTMDGRGFYRNTNAEISAVQSAVGCGKNFTAKVTVQARLKDSDPWEPDELEDPELHNSLFADTNGDGSERSNLSSTGTVYIENFRHIQNLSKAKNGYSGTVQAEQTQFIGWDTFFREVTEILSRRDFSLPSGRDERETLYQPVKPEGATLTYDGKGNPISGLYTSAGLFGELTNTTTIQNVKMSDTTVTGATNAGALIGSIDASGKMIAVTGVESYNDTTKGASLKTLVSGAENAGGLIGAVTNGDVTVSKSASYGQPFADKDSTESKETTSVKTVAGTADKPTSAGGLLGLVSGGTVTFHECAAAHIVGESTTTYAGGLVGRVSGGALEIKLSYASSSKTNSADGQEGKYLTDASGNLVADVNGANAAGLVGYVDAATGTSLELEKCYSTASAKGTSKAHFLVNAAEGATVTPVVSALKGQSEIYGTGSYQAGSGNVSKGTKKTAPSSKRREKGKPYNEGIYKAQEQEGVTFPYITLVMMDSSATCDWSKTHMGDWPPNDNSEAGMWSADKSGALATTDPVTVGEKQISATIPKDNARYAWINIKDIDSTDVVTLAVSNVTVDGSETVDTKATLYKLERVGGVWQATESKLATKDAAEKWSEMSRTAEYKPAVKFSEDGPNVQVGELEATSEDAKDWLLVTLDDITKDGQRFTDLFPDLNSGEEIRIRAGVDSNMIEFADLIDDDENPIRFDGTEKAPDTGYVLFDIRTGLAERASLLAGGDAGETAIVTNIRHLQNLSTDVSGVVDEFTSAKLADDLDWKEKSGDASVWEGKSIYVTASDKSVKQAKNFYGITNDHLTEFDGGDHTLTNFVMDRSASGESAPDKNAALFRTFGKSGDTETEYKVTNLTLQNPQVTSKDDGHAAALIANASGNVTVQGTATNKVTVKNPVVTAKGTGNAAGLIANASGNVTVQGTAANKVTVENPVVKTVGAGHAAGLVANATGADASVTAENVNLTMAVTTVETTNAETGAATSTTIIPITAQNGGNAAGLIAKAAGTVTADKITLTANGTAEFKPAISSTRNGHAAGLVAEVSKNVEIKEAELTSPAVMAQGSGNAAGLIADAKAGVTVGTVALKMSSDLVDKGAYKVRVPINIFTVNGGNASGLIAYAGDDVNITSVEMESPMVGTNDGGNAAGLVAKADKDVTVGTANLTWQSSAVTVKAGHAAGLVAEAGGNVTVTQATLESPQAIASQSTASDGNAAGLVAKANGNVTVTSVEIKNGKSLANDPSKDPAHSPTANAHGQGHAAGLVAEADDVTVTGNATLENPHALTGGSSAGNAAGLVAKAKRVTVNNVEMTENVYSEVAEADPRRPEITASGSGAAGGLIGKASNGATLNTVRVEEAKVSAEGAGAAGGLIGEASGTTNINTALVRSKTETVKSESGAAGGLVGGTSGALTITNSAATMYVSAVGDAGGLIGTVTDGTVNLTESYVGGHTKNGHYQETNVETDQGRWNVLSTGESGAAGGIVGRVASGATFNAAKSFSAASVSAASDKPAGGIVGTGDVNLGSATKIKANGETESVTGPVYAAGRVRNVSAQEEKQQNDPPLSTSTSAGAFAGVSAALTSANAYYLPQVYANGELFKWSETFRTSNIAYRGANSVTGYAQAVSYGDSDAAIAGTKDKNVNLEQRTLLYDKPENDEGAEYPFAIWTRFTFGNAEGDATPRPYYYGDFEIVKNEASINLKVKFTYQLGEGATQDLSSDSAPYTKYGGLHIFPPTLPRQDGYKFHHWELSPASGGTKVTYNGVGQYDRLDITRNQIVVTAKYPEPSNGDQITVNAVYEPASNYVVEYWHASATTGEASPAELSAYSLLASESVKNAGGNNKTYGELKPPMPYLAGYDFEGYYTSEGTQIFKADMTPVDSGPLPNASLTLYARFKKITYYEITFDFRYRDDDGNVVPYSSQTQRQKVGDELDKWFPLLKTSAIVVSVSGGDVNYTREIGAPLAANNGVIEEETNSNNNNELVRSKLHVELDDKQSADVTYTIVYQWAPVPSEYYVIKHVLHNTSGTVSGAGNDKTTSQEFDVYETYEDPPNSGKYKQRIKTESGKNVKQKLIVPDNIPDAAQYSATNDDTFEYFCTTGGTITPANLTPEALSASDVKRYAQYEIPEPKTFVGFRLGMSVEDVRDYKTANNGKEPEDAYKSGIAFDLAKDAEHTLTIGGKTYERGEKQNPYVITYHYYRERYHIEFNTKGASNINPITEIKYGTPLFSGGVDLNGQKTDGTYKYNSTRTGYDDLHEWKYYRTIADEEFKQRDANKEGGLGLFYDDTTRMFGSTASGAASVTDTNGDTYQSADDTPGNAKRALVTQLNAMPAMDLEVRGDVDYWTPKTGTPYRVIFWRQKVTDDVNASDDEKTYDYLGMVTRTGTTGDEAFLVTTGGNNDTNRSGKEGNSATVWATYSTSEDQFTANFVGCQYNATKTENANYLLDAKGDFVYKTVNGAQVKKNKTIAGDGSTILNVYYDRKKMTIHFQSTREYVPNDNGAYGYWNGNYLQLINGALWKRVQNVTYVYEQIQNPTNNQTGYIVANGSFVEATYSYSRGAWRYNGYSYYNTGYTRSTYTGDTDVPSGTHYTLGNGRFDEAGQNSNNRFIRVQTGGGGHNAVYTYYALQRETYEDQRYRLETYTQFKEIATMEGLYGQTLAKNGYTWPSAYYWWYDTSGNNSWDNINRNYGGTGSGMTFIDSFLDSNGGYGSGVEMTYYSNDLNSGDYTINHYKQSVDGTGYERANSTPTSGSVKFTFSEKYEVGFEVFEYLQGEYSDDADWNEIDRDKVKNKTASVNISSEDLHVRYRRNQHTLSFFDTAAHKVITAADNENFKPKNVYYGANINAQIPYDTDNPNETRNPPTTTLGNTYQWNGKWYVDEACTKELDKTTDTMPDADFMIYLKFTQGVRQVSFQNYDPVRNISGDDVTYTINGTTQASDYVPQTIKLYYGETVENRTTTDTSPDMLGPNPDYPFTSASGGIHDAYKPSKADYSFGGWYFADNTNDDGESKYYSAMPITKDLTLYPMWTSTEVVKEQVTVRCFFWTDITEEQYHGHENDPSYRVTDDGRRQQKTYVISFKYGNVECDSKGYTTVEGVNVNKRFTAVAPAIEGLKYNPGPRTITVKERPKDATTGEKVAVGSAQDPNVIELEYESAPWSYQVEYWVRLRNIERNTGESWIPSTGFASGEAYLKLVDPKFSDTGASAGAGAVPTGVKLQTVTTALEDGTAQVSYTPISEEKKTVIDSVEIAFKKLKDHEGYLPIGYRYGDEIAGDEITTGNPQNSSSDAKAIHPDSSLIISPGEDRTKVVKVRFYLETDPTLIHLKSENFPYDGNPHARDLMVSNAVWDEAAGTWQEDIRYPETLTPPKDSANPPSYTVDYKAYRQYWDLSKNPAVSIQAPTNAGTYAETAYIVALYTHGETTDTYLLWKSADYDKNESYLTISPRAITLKSASASAVSGGSPLTAPLTAKTVYVKEGDFADADANALSGGTVSVNGDGEVVTSGGEGKVKVEDDCVIFAVDAFRRNPGATSNVFDVKLPDALAKNYAVTKEYGTLTVN